jgi:hypothetical protein
MRRNYEAIADVFLNWVRFRKRFRFRNVHSGAGYPFFARRPTPAARIEKLASILPKRVSSNEILKLM